MKQPERDKLMSEFRAGNSRVLIATDIWGRGNLNISSMIRFGCLISVLGYQL